MRRNADGKRLRAQRFFAIMPTPVRLQPTCLPWVRPAYRPTYLHMPAAAFIARMPLRISPSLWNQLAFSILCKHTV